MDDDFNKIFLEKYNDDNISRLINSMVKPYRSWLDKEEIENCKVDGLWKALKKFDNSRKSSLNTFICNYVKWECRKLIHKKNKVNEKKENFRLNYKKKEVKNFDELYLYIGFLTQEQQKIVKMRLENRSLAEIGRILKIRRFTIRRIYEQAVEKLRALIVGRP